MPQKTLVLKIDPAQSGALRARLEGEDVEFRLVPHAHWSVKSRGVVATLYKSGKLLIQGLDPELFAQRLLGPAFGELQVERAAATGANSPAKAPDHGALIGSDECGKGDFFGPLVVAGVLLEPGQAERMRASGVRDSKLLSDEACLRLGGALRSTLQHSIARLDPVEYNSIHSRKGQLNDMLADLHAQVIRKLYRPGIHVLVDQFARASLMQQKLEGLDVRLEQHPRAESNPAVAAASIIAREEFLLALRALSDEHGVDLHKGAGEPVDRAARRFVELHGRQALASVAKVHFKNTSRIA